ncbi:leucine--tRNA ligase [Porphyromonas somerae]|uniref:Leucine--tRNA ligase n=1 Tax=Porphyromonas somerae TaxID=322095 RepID=A0A134B125_9PORP|nr:leucine--tRNA ligase [Porphyromonas somerae]KXB71782.1 leucine--tRNA ligase [Porphyromonadaceae bacterium KA00676]KXB73634.1 leucine--tRNA ligase [Porphyromonas somerae]
MEYNFRAIEARWQAYWRAEDVYRVTEDPSRPPYYVLDMFPYPSGAGLHVGHPLGYIASDIFARYKRLRGFNVLHPMGYDAFGLPAEQYAIQTGQHPEVTTTENIRRYREQLDQIGFSFDWSREVRTSDPEYYKWTQWVFIKLFHSYYNNATGKAAPISELIAHFETEGTKGINVAESDALSFTAEEWRSWDKKKQMQTLMNYRLAYLGETMVNWCAALGTVLANDEVQDGVSVRGGHPVEQKKMQQWCLRVSAYAGRLLDSLNDLEWSESLKESQRNWIGKSEGAEVRFPLVGGDGAELTVFTTRVDTIYGVTFMVLAPESDYVPMVTTTEQQAAVDEYLAATRRRTERDRLSDRRVSGVFSGSYATNPLTGEAIPIWISDYVLAGYGTGAVMAVPAHDSRDFAFARHFGLPIIQVVVPEGEEATDPATWEESKDSKSGVLINSGIITGLSVTDAIAKMKAHITSEGLGQVKTNYRLRDAIFSRQRYWGEPFPIYYDADGTAHTISEDELPLCLPEVDKFLPTSDGQPPLGRAKGWHTAEGFPYELSTMPGFAGSSAYYLRYMDPHNDKALVGRDKNAYWRHVDLYVGGAEHATGHLIYSRFWNKFVYDLGLVVEDEPFRKLVNQGMIQGRSNFVYRIKDTNTFVSLGLKDQYDTTPIHVDVNIVYNDQLDLEAFRAWRPEYATADFILEDGKYICGWAVEKMSKSMYNVVNPDMIVERYGADTLRLYEMFLGPLEQSKPWDTNGIDGVHRFLRKLWGLYYSADGLRVTDTPATKEELKSLHKLIRKVTQDVEQFSFNTSVAAFMICINELQGMKTASREVLQPLLILLAPFAPHIAEELWHAIGEETTIVAAQWPECDEKLLVEDSFKYPVSFNGKTRFTIELPREASQDEIREAVLSADEAQKWLEGKTPKKVIIVLGRIINIVL